MQNVHLKERLRGGETVIGTFSGIPSPSLVEAIGYSGLDFIVIDSEHGPVEMQTAENIVRAAEITGMVPIIRVPGNESHLILRALDIGAHGVQVPHVSTKEEAELAIEYSKYHPQGKRGLSPFTRVGKYGLAAENHTIRNNENVIVVVNIEGVEGVQNLSEITSVPEIDVIFIGPYDLSQSLGKPGQVEDPEVISFIKDSVKLIKSRGKSCGSFARDMKYLEILVYCGVQYITYTVDSAMVLESYKNLKELFGKLINNR
jgi:2-keto-3-deoxy-L-rhamnonate aldolase RhmA